MVILKDETTRSKKIMYLLDTADRIKSSKDPAKVLNTFIKKYYLIDEELDHEQLAEKIMKLPVSVDIRKKLSLSVKDIAISRYSGGRKNLASMRESSLTLIDELLRAIIKSKKRINFLGKAKIYLDYYKFKSLAKQINLLLNLKDKKDAKKLFESIVKNRERLLNNLNEKHSKEIDKMFIDIKNRLRSSH